MESELGSYPGGGARRGAAAPAEGPRGDEVMERSSRDFEAQHKLLLLETLYDAGLSLGSLPLVWLVLVDATPRRPSSATGTPTWLLARPPATDLKAGGDSVLPSLPRMIPASQARFADAPAKHYSTSRT